MAYSVGENMGKVNIEVLRGTEEFCFVTTNKKYIIYILVVQSKN